ncbi:MAG: GNAT family N-acetyltransferase [Gammaproteobacteria bacterium]|nr:GNAT family N-acetyltransferase [Gammaproteobacteria bacterium]MBT8134686.1 GNAT family N-acetyltransferase [Gammaproteobacteria bacterium]NNJ51004.1 GNAT family N-acetyltransferase [Gammaproteobacteria bacterium]
MRIEAATDKEKIAIIAALAEEIWREYFTPIIGKAQVDYMLKNFQSEQAICEQVKKGFLYYLIESDDSFVGYFGVLPKGDDLLLSKFYIRAAQRGKGLGRKSMVFIENLATENAASGVTLTVNKYNFDTIETYIKLGFKITESMVQDIGNGFVMDDYRMEKTLS